MSKPRTTVRRRKFDNIIRWEVWCPICYNMEPDDRYAGIVDAFGDWADPHSGLPQAMDEARWHTANHAAETTHQADPIRTHDPIARPAHYCDGRTHEPLDVILDWQLSFCLGNVVKYLSRAGRKGGAVEDLLKARVYLQREIDRLTEAKP